MSINSGKDRPQVPLSMQPPAKKTHNSTRYAQGPRGITPTTLDKEQKLGQYAVRPEARGDLYRSGSASELKYKADLDRNRVVG